jgi:exodeoxyribonuclease-3
LAGQGQSNKYGGESNMVIMQTQSVSSSIPSPLTIFCWNIANPSLKRAEAQAAWLRKQGADALVLTECKNSEGCRFLERYFQAYGYNVIFPRLEDNEHGVFIASRHKIASTGFSDSVDYIRSRVVSVSLRVPQFPRELEIIGVYVPSRDSSNEKTERKKRFVNSLLNCLRNYTIHSNLILCGDLNVLEPSHIPYYSVFQDWEYNFYTALIKCNMKDAFRYLNPDQQEYSWVGYKGDGYRFDHCFVSADLLPYLQDCYYLHETRTQQLSDHSALIVKLILS